MYMRLCSQSQSASWQKLETGLRSNRGSESTREHEQQVDLRLWDYQPVHNIMIV